MTPQLTDDAEASETTPADFRTAGSGTAAASDAGGPPQAWIERVVELYVEHDLPPLLMDPASAAAVDGRWQLHPWRREQDVTALLLWAMHLEAPVSIWRMTYGGGPVGDRAQSLRLHGSLGGHPTMLVGCSRLVPDDLTALDISTLRGIGAAEQRRLGRELAEVPLTLEDQADPLEVLRGDEVPA